MNNLSLPFVCGDIVAKTTGDYTFEGVVVAAFNKKSGAVRYVVEDGRGLLFIFNPTSLVLKQIIGENMSKVTCPYCNEPAKLITGDKLYPHRRDLYHKFFYQCAPCKAYVGCHPDSTKPLGRLATAELRKAKQEAHVAFDSIWRHGDLPRWEAYKWLAKELNIPADTCHIGQFDTSQCRRVIEICNRR